MAEVVKDKAPAGTNPESPRKKFRWTIPVVQLHSQAIKGAIDYSHGPLLVIDRGRLIETKEDRADGAPPKKLVTVVGNKDPQDLELTLSTSLYHECAIYVDSFGTKTRESRKKRKGNPNQLKLVRQPKRQTGWQPGYDDIPKEFGPEIPFNKHTEIKATPQVIFDYEMPKTRVRREIPEWITTNEPFLPMDIYGPLQFYKEDPTGKNREDVKGGMTEGHVMVHIHGTKRSFWNKEKYYWEAYVENADDPRFEGISGFISWGNLFHSRKDPSAVAIGF